MTKEKKPAKLKLKKSKSGEKRRTKKQTKVSGESKLALTFDARRRNGSYLRTIISPFPSITDRVTSAASGRGEKAIKDHFYEVLKRQTGKTPKKKTDTDYDYYFSDDMTAKYVRLAEISEAAGTSLYDVTVLLNDLANIKLRTVDADDIGSMIGKVRKWVYDSKLIKNGIIVIEECDNSDVGFWSNSERSVSLNDNQVLPRLHIHIITHLTKQEAQTLRDKFLKNKSSRILVKNYWDYKQEFTHLHDIEEETHGKVPFARPDPSNEHWLNQFTRKRFGKKYLYTRLPISLNYADYLTKQFHRGFTKDRTDTHIGLEGYKQVRERLAKLTKGSDPSVLPNRNTRCRF
ncbi:hypothetical protein [Vibrio sp. PNB22_4_1]